MAFLFLCLILILESTIKGINGMSFMIGNRTLGGPLTYDMNESCTNCLDSMKMNDATKSTSFYLRNECFEDCKIPVAPMLELCYTCVLNKLFSTTMSSMRRCIEIGAPYGEVCLNGLMVDSLVIGTEECGGPCFKLKVEEQSKIAVK